MVSRTQVAKRLKKRGEVWYVIVNSDEHGQTIKSTRCTDKEEAISVVQSSGIMEMELARKARVLSREVIKHITDDGKITVADAAIKFITSVEMSRAAKTARNTHDIMMHWMSTSHVKPIHPSEVNESHIHRFINRDDGTKLSTRILRWAVLKRFMEYCKDNGWCAKNVAKLVRPDYRLLTQKQRSKKVTEPYTEDEVHLILHRLNERLDSEHRLGSIRRLMFWSNLIEIAFITGLRYGDVVSLEWDSFESTISIHTNKTNKQITPIQQERLMKIVSNIPRSGPYIFPEQREIYVVPEKRNTFSSAFKKLCEELDVPYKGLHALRHGYATMRSKSGSSIDQIASELGHSQTSTTAGYIHEA